MSKFKTMTGDMRSWCCRCDKESTCQRKVSAGKITTCLLHSPNSSTFLCCFQYYQGPGKIFLLKYFLLNDKYGRFVSINNIV